jgi:hypothetical protein
MSREYVVSRADYEDWECELRQRKRQIAELRQRFDLDGWSDDRILDTRYIDYPVREPSQAEIARNQSCVEACLVYAWEAAAARARAEGNSAAVDHAEEMLREIQSRVLVKQREAS